MFPKIVFRDLGDLSSTIGTFKGVLPNEAEIIETEFVKEIHSMKYEPIERATSEERCQEIRLNDRVCRRYFIYGTEKESKLGGADLAIEVEGQVLIFVQGIREAVYHAFNFNRMQMLHLFWLENEIVHRISRKHPSHDAHSFSYKVPCFYKLNWMKRTIRPPSIIKEERYVPIRHVEFMLGRRQQGPSYEFRTGYSPLEFQEALQKCEAGSPDLEDIDLNELFLEYSKMTDRLVSFLYVM